VYQYIESRVSSLKNRVLSLKSRVSSLKSLNLTRALLITKTFIPLESLSTGNSTDVLGGNRPAYISYFQLVLPVAQTTTRGFLAVTAGALEGQTVAHTALKKWLLLLALTFSALPFLFPFPLTLPTLSTSLSPRFQPQSGDPLLESF